MAIIKCKMCGGDLNLVEGASTATCEYCGSVQTIPNLDDEKKLIQFERAERLRKQCEFDKAAGIYETIVADFRQEAEAYWGLVLCKFGIEYVDDPATGKKIPTCHRSSFDSIMDDSDFEQALENADGTARKVYREEAKQIEEIRKGIIAVSANEEPYDIFICYKETAENGDRTLDSVLAQDVYDALIGKGYRVFFSRITLEDKLGVEYEPYIFAALHSAKIMLAFGTDYEYFNAVWVKNEWSRFLKLMAKDKEKHLIPCFKGIDAYDMPKEFAKLQAQDLGKVGAIQDLLRGIEKILPMNRSAASAPERVVLENRGNIDAMLRRVRTLLSEENWTGASECCERMLDLNDENPQAYIGKLLAELHIKDVQALASQNRAFDNSINYQKALRYADDMLKKTLEESVASARKNEIYGNASAMEATAKTIEELARAKAEFAKIENWKDANKRAAICEKKIEECKVKEEAERLEQQRQAEIAIEKAKEKQKKWARVKIVIAASLCVAVICFFVITKMIIPYIEDCKYMDTYNKAMDAIAAEDYLGAYRYLMSIGEYRDAKELTNRMRIRFSASESIGAGIVHIVGIKADGTVVAVGNDYYGACNVSSWEDIISISVGESHTVGLREDGTVVATGANNYGQCNVSDWRDIVAISAGDEGTVGLSREGEIVTSGKVIQEKTICEWEEIVGISTSGGHTVGLRIDGTVVATGANNYGQCNVQAWTDIAAVSVNDTHTVGLKTDGTVVAMGSNGVGQCNVNTWSDIISICAGPQNTVGLKRNGTVIVVGDNSKGQCDVSGWKDIVAISAGKYCTIGLKADGTVVVAGSNAYGFNKADGWTNIKLPNK